MWITDVFKARQFRLALAFSVAIALATFATFTFIYLGVNRADIRQTGAILVDEAAKSEGDSEAQLRQALELRLTRDLRRLEYVSLFDSHGALILGNVPALPDIPVDGQPHVVQEQPLPDASGAREPALLVARKFADGRTILLGRSLWETFSLQETLLRALAIALLPTVLVILAIGVIFARTATQRYERVHEAIVRIMNGELESRLPVTNDDRDIDKVARSVNLMLDEIARLLDRLQSVGDNIAHDLRTPLTVARVKIERALNNETGIEQLRDAMAAALAQIEKVSTSISAILRVSAVENGVREKQFSDFDLAAVCAQVFDFYEPCAESNSIAMVLDAEEPVWLRGDEDLMREAISNLVDNAIKFTPAGGEIRIEARLSSGRPIVGVSDSGVGVPPQEREKIFGRFYRGQQSGGSPGHGLGLSIADAIAKLHGFELTVADNRPGARFEMRSAAEAAPDLAHERV